jgi:hypothetical protein
MIAPSFFLFVASILYIIVYLYFAILKKQELKKWPKILIQFYRVIFIVVSLVAIWGIVAFIVYNFSK